MRPYTFYMYERGRTQPSFDFIFCESDREAEAAARRLMARERDLTAVEIFNGRDWRRTLSANSG